MFEYIANIDVIIGSGVLQIMNWAWWIEKQRDARFQCMLSVNRFYETIV